MASGFLSRFSEAADDGREDMVRRLHAQQQAAQWRLLHAARPLPLLAQGDTLSFGLPAMEKLIFSVAPDGSVALGPDLDLAAVRRLEMPYLLALREIVNTAIYDKERGR